MSGFRRMMMANIKPYHPNETVYDVAVANAETTYTIKVENPYSDVVINWGDGTYDTITKPAQIQDVSHVYHDAGCFIVRIYAADKASAYRFYHGSTLTTSAELVTRVRQFGNNLFRGKFILTGCINLAKIDPGCKIAALVDKGVDQLFQQCGSNVEGGTLINDDFTIPDDVRQCYGLFYYSNLDHLPTSFRVPSACTGMRSFASNATSMAGDITNIFPEAWASKTATIDIGGAFSNCRKITGTAPAHLLWNAPNITWSDTTDCFAGCTGLTNYNEIPASWGGGGA